MNLRRGTMIPPRRLLTAASGAALPPPPPSPSRAELEAVGLRRRVEYLEVQLKQAEACIDDLLQRLFETRGQMVAAVERAYVEAEARDRAEARMMQASAH